jgi:hypothetical protein
MKAYFFTLKVWRQFLNNFKYTSVIFINDIDGYYTYYSRYSCSRVYLVLFVELTVTDLDLVGDIDLDKDLV